MKKIIAPGLLSILLVIAAFAQQPSANPSTTTQVKKAAAEQRQSQARRGSISGRVVSDSGQPLAHIAVTVSAMGNRAQMNQRNLGTDEEGRFQADDLSAATYQVSPFAPGYILANQRNEVTVYRLGDSVTFTMTKGGVITGMVKSATGEPVINVSVRAIRVKDAEGKAIRSANIRVERLTDDRGIYRLYGLESGTYIVMAGGNGFYSGGYDKYSEDIPTYHPSSTRDTANEILVTRGQEVSSIDIAYRGEKGKVISGSVANHPNLAPNYAIGVMLINAITGVQEATASASTRSDSSRSFSFFGISDGEYLVKAMYVPFNDEKNTMASAAKRIVVKGGDVTGVELALAPLASISGRIIFEPLTDEAAKKKCEPAKDTSLEEALIFIRRDDQAETPQLPFNPPSQFSGDEKGEFTLYRFEAGRYRLSANLPSDTWYVKSIGFPKTAKPNQPASRNAQLSDVATRGLNLKAGERISDLTITINEGAASLSGKVSAPSERDALPANLRVYLVPAERERANDALRFVQAQVQSDGKFSLTNLAPGKYWIVTRIASDDELTDNAPRPLYWDIDGRNQLRKEAEAANIVVELQTCQRLADYGLRYTPPKPATKKL
ncbi:MAG: carboxypeptidase-like regulatory domain-containing protein [Acidobacteriota bacterium]